METTLEKKGILDAIKEMGKTVIKTVGDGIQAVSNFVDKYENPIGNAALVGSSMAFVGTIGALASNPGAAAALLGVGVAGLVAISRGVDSEYEKANETVTDDLKDIGAVATMAAIPAAYLGIVSSGIAYVNSLASGGLPQGSAVFIAIAAAIMGAASLAAYQMDAQDADEKKILAEQALVDADHKVFKEISHKLYDLIEKGDERALSLFLYETQKREDLPEKFNMENQVQEVEQAVMNAKRYGR